MLQLYTEEKNYRIENITNFHCQIMRKLERILKTYFLTRKEENNLVLKLIKMEFSKKVNFTDWC